MHLSGKAVTVPPDNWQVESIAARSPGTGALVHSSHTGASPPGAAKGFSFKGRVNATPGWGGAEERFESGRLDKRTKEERATDFQLSSIVPDFVIRKQSMQRKHSCM